MLVTYFSRLLCSVSVLLCFCAVELQSFVIEVRSHSMSPRVFCVSAVTSMILSCQFATFASVTSLASWFRSGLSRPMTLSFSCLLFASDHLVHRIPAKKDSRAITQVSETLQKAKKGFQLFSVFFTVSHPYQLSSFSNGSSLPSPLATAVLVAELPPCLRFLRFVSPRFSTLYETPSGDQDFEP